MKLATLFTTVTLLTALSCLPKYQCSQEQKRRLPHANENSVTEAPIPEPEPKRNENAKKLNILILTITSPGHISVPLALAEELARRGHHVTFSTSSNKSQAAAEKVHYDTHYDARKSQCMNKNSVMYPAITSCIPEVTVNQLSSH